MGSPIVSRAIVKELGHEGEAAAEAHEAAESRAALDAADLRELERAEYYNGAPTPVPAPAAAARRRGLLDRLLRR
jgi:hypothetical protein